MMQTMQIRLTKDMINELKMLVQWGLYPNVSEAVRDSVRRLITAREAPIKSLPEQKEQVEQITEKLDKQVKKQVKEFQNPKGTEDLYPEQQAIKNKVFQRLRKTAKNFTFQNAEPPILESFDLLAAKQGEEIRKQIFTIEKKGDEELAMRAEFTPSFARMFISKQKNLPKPVKWFTINRVWRYERPQSGRQREFYQFNCELYGSKEPEADAEVISLVIESLLSLKLTQDMFILKINNRKLLQGIVELFSKKIDAVIRTIDKKEKVTQEDFIEMLKENGVNKPEELIKILETKNIKDLEKLKLNQQAKQGLEELKQILDLLNYKCIELSLSTARGLAYYTGTVFEIFDKNQKLRSIAGGGRYDKMIESFNGQPTPAIGFGMGYSTLSQLLEINNLLPKPDLEIDYCIITIDQSVLKQALEIANKLRKKYSVAMDLNRRKLGNQFKYAETLGAKKAIVIGPDEIKTKELTIKDMKTREQEKIKIDDL